nr:YicC/YloC family endoribonuclease [Aneurinibacillus terranovensis]
MVHSMTGYGRAERRSERIHLIVEMRSVNHRFNEISLRLPRELGALEDAVRRTIQSRVRRGRVDVFITMKSDTVPAALQVNWELARQYAEAARRMSEMLGRQEEVSAYQIMGMPDVIHVNEEQMDPEMYRIPLMEAVEEAGDMLVSMRKIEGQALYEDIFLRLKYMSQLVENIKELAPRVTESYRERIRARIVEYIQELVPLDEARLLNEVALFAERADISEEITRLASHFSQFTQIMEEGEPVGRKLDFLVQECHREINTIGSKANYLEISQKVVILKAELEKVKEQVQNIE